MTDLLWQAKLDARLHDPAEKALILMRTAHGHEGGTSDKLRKQLQLKQLPQAVKDVVRRADHWASAADRAAYPRHDADGRYPAWQNVHFHRNPVFIHPLTGAAFDLGRLTADVDPDAIEALSIDHHRKLLHGDGDARRNVLALWRFGPELNGSDLDSLWRLLPADSRVPDHSIWDHLDLTSALAGAFAADPDGGPALLAVSLGPVQSMIAAARTTSDLWAGSHLLSRLSWEAMRVVCEQLGPDAILFPRLRGVPQVDLWLRDECGLPAELFQDCDWARGATDANPLFAAALPNRFTALVPANRAGDLAAAITRRVNEWVIAQTDEALRALLHVAGHEDDPQLHGYAQIREQLAGFPEVHWAAVPWSLVATNESGHVEASDSRLAEAMQPFFTQSPPGFLGTPAWGLLNGGFLLEEGWFWRPNPGALYPALHELLERALAAAKSTQTFAQTAQQGWRDSLTGEVERLTCDRAGLTLRADGLWKAVAEKQPSLVRPGEQLGAINTLKRLWPRLFVRELKAALGKDVPRFVVSTHTMALANSLERWLDRGESLPDRLAAQLDGSVPRVSMPRKLALKLHHAPDAERLMRLPGWLETERESGDEQRIKAANGQLRDLFGHTPEAYYSLVLMDGDRMGAWLSADREYTLAHEECFHPQIRQASSNRFGNDANFSAYAKSLRAANPARHMAISEALNNFSLTLAPAIVERQFHGRVLYAGGDDLLAMLPVNDMLPAMAALRGAYSGIAASTVGGNDEDGGYSRQTNGFVHHGNRVLRVMGEKATASMGAVIAHHQTPLNQVLRKLREAESRAKNAGGRDAFAITILKRSGGAVQLTCKWSRKDHDSPMACLRELAQAIGADEASRRAAYNVQMWSADLPEPGMFQDHLLYREMLRQTLVLQFKRQQMADSGVHAKRLADMAPTSSGRDAIQFINNFLSVAEFLAREGRGQGR